MRDTVQLAVQFESTPEGVKLGFYNHPVMMDYKPTHISYGFFESFPAGIKYGWNVLAGYVGDMKYVFSKEGAKSLGGFGALGSLFPSMWELACLLDDDRILEYHLGIHEHPSYPSLGWRSCLLLAL